MRETFHFHFSSFRFHTPCSNSCRRIQIPSLIRQCISTKLSLPLTPCQITEAAYDGQKHIFPHRARKWYSVGYSLILLVFKVMYIRHAMCHVTRAALIL